MDWRLIVFVVFLGMIQFLTSSLHWNHYQKTIKEMSSKSSGFLGVGMSKKRFLPRKILVITTDQDGIIDECRILTGVTVFSKFKNCDDFKEQSIQALKFTKKTNPYKEALKIAIELIEKEKNK